eukprot:3940713-Rhodomonas_salina.3
MVLRAQYAMPGPDAGYGGTRSCESRRRRSSSRSKVGCGRNRQLLIGIVLQSESLHSLDQGRAFVCRIAGRSVVRVCYERPSTVVRMYYETPGTDLRIFAYQAMDAVLEADKKEKVRAQRVQALKSNHGIRILCPFCTASRSLAFAFAVHAPGLFGTPRTRIQETTFQCKLYQECGFLHLSCTLSCPPPPPPPLPPLLSAAAPPPVPAPAPPACLSHGSGVT